MNVKLSAEILICMHEEIWTGAFGWVHLAYNRPTLFLRDSSAPCWFGPFRSHLITSLRRSFVISWDPCPTWICVQYELFKLKSRMVFIPYEKSEVLFCTHKWMMDLKRKQNEHVYEGNILRLTRLYPLLV